MLFLGAGASRPFGKPITSEFKNLLVDEISVKYHQSTDSIEKTSLGNIDDST